VVKFLTIYNDKDSAGNYRSKIIERLTLALLSLSNVTVERAFSIYRVSGINRINPCVQVEDVRL